MHSTFRFVQVRPAMTLRSGSFVLSRISITTQLLIWFLCLSLIPCVVLTGIISLPVQPILEEERFVRGCWRSPTPRPPSSRPLSASAAAT